MKVELENNSRYDNQSSHLPPSVQQLNSGTFAPEQRTVRATRIAEMVFGGLDARHIPPF